MKLFVNSVVKGVLILSIAMIIFSGCKPKPASSVDPREANRVLDKPAKDYIKGLDDTSKNAVFVFTKNYPEFKGLHNKVIQLKPLNLDLSINSDEYVHKDFMGPVYILLPAYYIGIRATVMMKCFPAYKGFKLKELSENYALYYATQKR